MEEEIIKEYYRKYYIKNKEHIKQIQKRYRSLDLYRKPTNEEKERLLDKYFLKKEFSEV